jgi:hypothetical protein
MTKMAKFTETTQGPSIKLNNKFRSLINELDTSLQKTKNKKQKTKNKKQKTGTRNLDNG